MKTKKKKNTFYLYITIQETQRHFTCKHKSNTLERNIKATQ